MPNGTERALAEVRKHSGVALAEVRKHSGVSRNHPESQVDASPDGLRPIPSKSRYGTVLEVVVFWAAKCPLQEKGGQNSSATRLCSGSVAWPSEAVRGVRMTHAKKHTKDAKKTAHPFVSYLERNTFFRNSHSHPSGRSIGRRIVPLIQHRWDLCPMTRNEC